MSKYIYTAWLEFKKYYRSHIWCLLGTAIIISVFLVSLLMHFYLKDEYFNYLKERTYETEKSVLFSVNKNVGLLIREFINIGCEIAINDELYHLVKLYEKAENDQAIVERSLKNILSKYNRYSQWIVNISVSSKKGLIFQYDRDNYTSGSLWSEENEDILINMNNDVFSLLSEDIIPRYVPGTYPIIHPQNDNIKLFHIAFPLKGSRKFENVSHSVVVSFDAGVLSKFLDVVHEDSKSLAHGYITNKDDIIVFHDDKSYMGEKQGVYIINNNLQNIKLPMDKLGWFLNIAIDEEKLLSQVDRIYYRGIAFFSIILLLLIVAFSFIIKLIVLKPVKEIKKSMYKVKEGNLYDREIHIEGYHEIWQLANEYNKMIKSLRVMNEKVEKYHQEKYIYMKKKEKAEREALKSQINAHFIHNTLGVINYEAIESGNRNISILIKKLSNILRYTFSQKENVYLFQELAWIEQYLFLQKFRLENVFNYEINVPVELQNWPCIKLMLQPFVENSILHGFKGLQKGGKIHIFGELHGGKLKLMIQDNGMGMNEKMKRTIKEIINNPFNVNKKGIGIGISNVLTRMEMYYGEGLNVQLQTSVGSGTKFVFLIPFSKNNK